MKDKRLRTFAYVEKAAAIAVALCVWQIASMWLSQEILLASPISVLKALLQILSEKDCFATLGYSLGRILLGFFLGLLVGAVFAYGSFLSHLFETFLWPYMALIRITPVVSFIILCLVWLSGRNLSVFIAFLMVLPVVYINLLAGFRGLDPKLSQMAEVFCLNKKQKLLYIYLPQLMKPLIAALRVSIGLAFKAGMAAEVIGIPKGSIGRRLYDAKLYLATDELFAWTFLIIVMSLVCEKLIVIALHALGKRTEGLLWK